MARKNTFQLVEENYDIPSEIRKINDLFYTKQYFSTPQGNRAFDKFLDKYLFSKWKYRDTCLAVDEYIQRAKADIPNNKHITLTEEQVINNLEVMENFLKLFFDNADALYDDYGIEWYTDLETVFWHLIKIMEKRMGLTVREYKDRIVLYLKNAPLEKVIDLCDDEDVQWELIRYVREDLTLNDKRKSLAYLATNLYIEKDDSETDEHIKQLIRKAENILNNLHIRHNNKTGKWENNVLEGLDEKDAISLCDMVYNEMLTIVLLREHKEYDKVYTEFNKKQKEESKAKKKAEEVKNG